MKEEWLLFGLLGVAGLVLVGSFLSALNLPKIGGQSSTPVQSFQQTDDCGNLRDVQNVQHLSHHPDRYASCLRKVDPAFLKQATGQTLQQILG